MVHGQSSGGVGLSTTRRHENRSRWVDRAVANFMSYVDDSLTNLRWNGWHRTGEINPAADNGDVRINQVADGQAGRTLKEVRIGDGSTRWAPRQEGHPAQLSAVPSAGQ